MSKIIFFYLNGCPYCRNAKKAIAELRQNPLYSQTEIQEVEETEQPDIADRYDYFHVPAMFIGQDKQYECQPGEDYESIRRNIRRVFDAAGK